MKDTKNKEAQWEDGTVRRKPGREEQHKENGKKKVNL